MKKLVFVFVMASILLAACAAAPAAPAPAPTETLAPTPTPAPTARVGFACDNLPKAKLGEYISLNKISPIKEETVKIGGNLVKKGENGLVVSIDGEWVKTGNNVCLNRYEGGSEWLFLSGGKLYYVKLGE